MENTKRITQTTVVMTGQGTNYLSIDNVQGSVLISAINGDWNAAQYIPLGLAFQIDHYVFFFQNVIPSGVSIRINMLWVKL